MEKISSLGIPMSPQEISKKYKRQSLGMPKASPSSSIEISGHLSRRYIFIASYDMCYSWSISYFCFQFCFALFAVVYSWILVERSSFHSYYSVSVHFLLVLRLALVFHSYFVQSLLVFLSYV